MSKAKKALEDVQTKAKKLWDENPVICIMIGIASAQAGAKLMQANSSRVNAKAWNRETKRRVKADKKK